MKKDKTDLEIVAILTCKLLKTSNYESNAALKQEISAVTKFPFRSIGAHFSSLKNSGLLKPGKTRDSACSLSDKAIELTKGENWEKDIAGIIHSYYQNYRKASEAPIVSAKYVAKPLLNNEQQNYNTMIPAGCKRMIVFEF